MEETVSRRVIGSAIEVHRQLGPGLMEFIYQACLVQELTSNRIAFAQQVELPIVYKGVSIDRRYRIDLIVEQALVVEVKAVQQLLPVHRAQLLTYLRLTGLRTGLLLNFNTVVLKDGIMRVVN
jgi:GxxExxY protein